MIVINSSPTVKLGFLNTRKSTSGSFVVNSQMMKPMNVSAEIATSQQIQSERNQSSSWPLSSVICNVASHTASKPNPTKSMAAFSLRLIYGGASTQHFLREIAPDHDAQVMEKSPAPQQLFVSQPPIVRPC